jgi:hypothetical protein
MSSKVWERRADAGESLAAYRAFLAYRDQGPGRSLAGPKGRRKGVGRASGRTYAWSARFEWVYRSSQWDVVQQSIRDDATRKAVTVRADEWVTRRFAAADADYSMGNRLRMLAIKMSEFPLVRRVVPNGKRTKTSDDLGSTTVEPAAWSMRDAALIARTASDLQARAVDSATIGKSLDDPSLDGPCSEADADKAAAVLRLLAEMNGVRPLEEED